MARSSRTPDPTVESATAKDPTTRDSANKPASAKRSRAKRQPLLLLWRVLVFLAALSPLTYWAAQVALGNGGPEPGRYLLLNIGQATLWMLFATLSLTPLTKLTRWKGFALIRRQLGLWTLAYAVAHLLCYALFILGLDLSRLGSEIVRRPYIIVGMLALLGLAVMGVTSNQWSMRRLGKRWKTLHKLVYAVLALGLLHFFWVVRADMEQWSLYAATGAFLMLLRLPPIARRLPAIRQRAGRQRPS